MDKSSVRIEVAGELKKLSMTEDDVLILSFKDVRLHQQYLKNKGFQNALRKAFEKAFGREVGMVMLPPGLELGVIEKKEIAPWKAYNDFTGELGLGAQI